MDYIEKEIFKAKNAVEDAEQGYKDWARERAQDSKFPDFWYGEQDYIENMLAAVRSLLNIVLPLVTRSESTVIMVPPNFKKPTKEEIKKIIGAGELNEED